MCRIPLDQITEYESFLLNVSQISWRSEISIEFEKMRNESANLQNLHQLQRLDDELIQRRKEELK